MSKPASGASLDSGNSLYSALTAAGSAVWAMLEGGSSSTSADSSGNGHTLALTAPFTWSTDGSGNAIIRCAGATTDGMIVTSPPTMGGTDSWSLAFRFHQTTSGARGIVAGDDAGGLFVWGFTGNFLAVHSSLGSYAGIFTGTTSFTADADYLLVFNHAAGQIHLYKDGVEDGSSPQTVSSVPGVFTSICGGNDGTGTNSLIGSITYAYLMKGYAASGTDATTLHSDPYAIFATGGSPLAAGTLSVTGHTPSSVSLSLATNTGGTAPYSSQLQRAPDVAGSPGSFSNDGSPVAGATPTFTSSGLTANTKYWFQVVVTDSAGSPGTATSNQVSQTTSPQDTPELYGQPFGATGRRQLNQLLAQ